ncbi:MAG: hypothetical protein A2Y57_04850 [Candidatus Woykebacteria bacterium RBG_13_40_7b]|uniref:N-acetyltransferase domain-containing protein n=1 Tax=Candidatus Woykebacteria bacterium RBG_13_40_7b TaxID=1802594 RepID=A0A1G1WBS9_9BACT|nr:MAG: hypothetical protein A2Y57_04850 [Candidatus Woykebacteria bacterium RBG_13_40_7b]
MEGFITKKGKRIIIREPGEDDLEKLFVFFNKLINEDTFILRSKEDKVTFEEERKWFSEALSKIRRKEAVFIQAYYQNQLVGQVEVRKGQFRKKFVGTLHIAVDCDFRGEGIGEELMKQSEENCKNLGIKIISLNVYDRNDIAIGLYKKMGFTELGRLPKAIEFQGGFGDEVYMYKRID